MSEKQYIDLSRYGKNQKLRKKYFGEASIRHPAKMDLPLCRWIIDKFCLKDKSEIILDPMAGVGSTLIMGMLMRPKSLFIGIELEEKFVKWANASIKKTERIAKENWFMEVGKAVCVQGDARELEKVLKEKVNKIISSPPYAENTHHSDNAQELEYLRPGRKSRVAGTAGEREDNIGQLSYGKADKIISSPPYSDVVSNDKEGPSAGANEKKYGRWKKGTAKKQSYTQLNKPSKINKIIS